MENDNLIAGLIRKKAEITAQVEALQIQLRQLIMGNCSPGAWLSR